MAAPKCISGRTSYLRVRLAFHPYPQVLRAFCNRHRCGPPRGLTRASACPWIAHPVSGRFPATQHALFRLAFAAAPGTTPLASPPRITRRSVLQKVRRHGLPRSDWLWALGFRISFTPRFRGAFHRSLTVLCTIGPSAYLALEGGPPRFRRDVACPGVLTIRTAAPHLSPTGLSPAVAARSSGLRLDKGVSHCAGAMPDSPCGRTTPRAQRRHPCHAHGLGSRRFARRYSGAILLPPGT